MRSSFALILYLCIASIIAAEIRNGQLHLEINILEGQSIKISSKGNLIISEIASPLSREYNDEVSLHLFQQDQQKKWGLLNKTELIQPDSLRLYLDDTIREKFVWLDSKLLLQYEKLTYEDKYFDSKEAAEQYALQTGYPKKSIVNIPMQNATLKVTTTNNKTHFYQLPVKIQTQNPISFNEQQFDYDGVFTVKQIDGKLIFNNLRDLENYIAGVVPNEIGNLAPDEALKAQAVAARTHAISMLLFNKHAIDGYDLCNGTHCQVYKGNHLRTKSIDKAVLETKGIVILYEDKIADAVYHSNCGGKTETNQGAWAGKPIPFLQGVACFSELDSIDLSIESNAVNWINKDNQNSDMASWESRTSNWERSIKKSTLEKNSGVNNLRSINIVVRGYSGRILKLLLKGSNEITIDGEYKIRQMFGGLPSSFFQITNGKRTNSTYFIQDNILLRGKGAGHGVGLCQVGTIQKARMGWKWDELLRFYYPDTILSDDWLKTTYDKQSR